MATTGQCEITMKASTTARGYGTGHQKLRAHWTPIVQAGQAQCHAERCLKSSRWIPPGTPWDLGHTPDRTAYTGPEHRTCNRSDGARRGNALRRKPPTKPIIHSRNW